MVLEKLSVIERKFAEENHNLIYGLDVYKRQQLQARTI